jgi:GNAT superfamily N-acetyltransferase
MSSRCDIRLATPADAAAIARVHLASWQTAYRGIFSDAYLDGLMATYPKRLERWQAGLVTPESPGTATFIAEIPEHGVIGFATAGSERKGRADFKGELHAIYLLGEHRGQGIGKLLFARCVKHVRGLGLETMIVWVLKNNPWRAFYESMGGELIGGETLDAVIGGTPVVEIAYGWKKLVAAQSRS